MKIAVRAAMIRASVLAPLLRRLDEAGQADALLRGNLMSRAELADPYALISLARYNALFESAAAALNDPAIGLKLGRRHGFLAGLQILDQHDAERLPQTKDRFLIPA